MNYFKDKDEIKNLIKSGFDIELISLEFDIEIEELKKIKYEIENPVMHSFQKINGPSKLEIMRNNYKKLYYESTEIEEYKPQKNSEEETNKINSMIDEIETLVNDIDNLKVKEKRENLKKVLNLVRKLRNFHLSISQTEKIKSLLNDDSIRKMKFQSTDPLRFSLQVCGKIVDRKYAESLDTVLYYTDNIDELTELRKKITSKMTAKDPIFLGGVKRKINSKIDKIKSKQAFDNINNNVSEEITTIVKNLINGNIDIQASNEIIKQLAQKRVKSKPKTKFSLTEEQERTKILMQIHSLLIERASIYKINNPQSMIKQLKDLLNYSDLQATEIVIENLICNKRFEEAKNITNQMSYAFPTNTYKLHKRIINAEIGDMVLKAVRRRRSYS